MLHHENQEEDQEVNLKSFFVPLTTLKAIHWIVIIGFIVFGNMLFNGFVWDDRTYILLNPDSHSIDIPKFFGETLFNKGGLYRPLTSLYLATLYTIFGVASFYYHFLQLCLHIVNTTLVYSLFNKFFGKKISIFLSLIFLTHPIQVESVSYIASIGTPLFFFFGITALLLSLKNEMSRKRLSVVIGLLLLSLLTRETGFLFLFIILYYRLLFSKSLRIVFIVNTLITTALYFVIRIGLSGIFFQKKHSRQLLCLHSMNVFLIYLQ